MKNKKFLVMITLLVAICLLGIGTMAYFRRIVNGDIIGQTGNLVLIVNEANAALNESFSVSLNRSDEEPYVMPDDKGTFNLNIDSNGSSTDVDITITMLRTNLPENLKFYLDSDYTQELTTKTYMLKKSDDMTMTVPVYWFWDGSVDDENDSRFIGEQLIVNVEITASVHTMTLHEFININNPILDTNVDFGSSGVGLYIASETSDYEYPVVYVRGPIPLNITFGGMCWLFVRTTETGGIKLIYNGLLNEHNGCNDYTGVSGTINENYNEMYINNTSNVSFNLNDTSPVYAGYMYNDDKTYCSGSYCGSFDATGYIEHLSDNTIDSETGRHNQNKYDSNVKSIIDEWYKENIFGKEFEYLIEDTVWCNDRSVISETYSIENFATNNYFNFAASTRLYENTTKTPSMVCNRNIDKFTVSKVNGNGDLTYPVGLLTADEVSFAGLADGLSVETYLSHSKNGPYGPGEDIFHYWLLSPYWFSSGELHHYNVSGGYIANKGVDNSAGVRPSVSVINTAKILGGNGTFSEPYLIG